MTPVNTHVIFSPPPPTPRYPQSTPIVNNEEQPTSVLVASANIFWPPYTEFLPCQVFAPKFSALNGQFKYTRNVRALHTYFIPPPPPPNGKGYIAMPFLPELVGV